MKPSRGQHRVSVVMPVHNGGRFLHEAISSVLGQTFDDLELVIVDDASTDNSLEVAQSFNDPRVRVLHNERNLGFGGNWNRCLDEARGDYVKLLPQDDVLHADCLRQQVAVLDQDAAGKLAFVFCARRIIGPTGKSFLRRGLGHRARVFSSHRLVRHAVRWGTNPVGEPGAVLFRQTLARQVGPFNGRLPFVTDLDYWVRLLDFGAAAYLPETLCAFRVSRQSQSVAISRRQSEEFSAFLDTLANRRDGVASPIDIEIGKHAARLRALARLMVYRSILGKHHGQ